MSAGGREGELGEVDVEHEALPPEVAAQKCQPNTEKSGEPPALGVDLAVRCGYRAEYRPDVASLERLAESRGDLCAVLSEPAGEASTLLRDPLPGQTRDGSPVNLAMPVRFTPRMRGQPALRPAEPQPACEREREVGKLGVQHEARAQTP